MKCVTVFMQRSENILIDIGRPPATLIQYGGHSKAVEPIMMKLYFIDLENVLSIIKLLSIILKENGKCHQLELNILVTAIVRFTDKQLKRL